MDEEIEVQSEIIKWLVKGMQLKFEFKNTFVHLSELPSYHQGKLCTFMPCLRSTDTQEILNWSPLG